MINSIKTATKFKFKFRTNISFEFFWWSNALFTFSSWLLYRNPLQKEFLSILSVSFFFLLSRFWINNIKIGYTNFIRFKICWIWISIFFKYSKFEKLKQNEISMNFNYVSRDIFLIFWYLDNFILAFNSGPVLKKKL